MSDVPCQEQLVVLAVDDEPVVRVVLCRALTSFGYRVRLAEGGAEAIAELDREAPDIVILDVEMPEVDGLQVLRFIRAQSHLSHLPCLLLTAHDTIRDKAAGFDQGADDYITKPFDLIELDLRLKALLRRKTPSSQDVLRTGEIELHLSAHRAMVRGEVVNLTQVEFELLAALMRARSGVVSTEQLLHTVWGYPLGTGNYGLVRMHILNLRRKIEVVPHEPRYILTIPHRGYRLSR